ncbi:MAG TPA: HEAT repeat domain-containing protein, partial [Candidatus Binatia bacterium]|nr:HEAT repeat domain-containing protein [Candidatus Binatia bacterium]
TQDPKGRALLAMVLTRHFANDSGPVVLKALRHSQGALAEGFVFALATRPLAAPFSAQETERFWFEGFHSPLFGEAMFPDFRAQVAGTAGAPKSFRAWHDRVGHVDEGIAVTAALEAAVRTPDADQRNGILFILKPPSRDLKGLLEAVQGMMAGATDPDDRITCLALLANDPSEGARRFLEEQAISAPQPEVRAKAALTLVRWDVPDVADRFQRIYAACPDPSSRQSLLDKAYRADTAAMQAFLLNVVSSERDAELRTSAVTAVGRTDARLHVPEKQAILQRGMSDSDADVRTAAVEAVSRLKWTALRENVRILASSDASEKVRSTASRTLAALGQ